MKDYCKDIKSKLTPKRDTIVRQAANWLCHVRDTGHCKKHTWTETVLAVGAPGKPKPICGYIFVKPDKTAEELFDDVALFLPERIGRNQVVVCQESTSKHRKPLVIKP